MKRLTRLGLALGVLLASTSASAVKIPLPIEGATLNVSFQLQTQALFNENGSIDGTNPAFDIFIRRSRLLVNGDVNNHFSYLIQLDNPNFGKNGNFTGRGYIQDAWFGFAPTGIYGEDGKVLPTVLYIDAGLLLIPISRHFLESTTNFTTADVHTESWRGISGATFPGLRDTGVQVRGWALDKKIGFRGGVFEGVRGTPGALSATNPNAGLNPKSLPRFAGFVNVDLIGSEEGAWLYGATHFGKDMILSVGGSTLYQAQVSRGPNGLSDSMINSLDAYLDFPLDETQELVVQATGYRASNGGNSKDTGFGGFVDVGYRWHFVEPYVSFDGFFSDSCADADIGSARCFAGTADSRNFRAGLNFFINKNLNHVNVEFSVNRGQSAYGGQSVSPAAPGNGNNLALSGTKSLLVHWNLIF